jgi:ATP-dependent helicase/nuclease subunit B
VGVAKAESGELLYLRLSGGIDVGAERRILPKGKQPAQLASEALAGLERLVARYADQAQPYLARPRVRFVAEHGDYDRLARVAEWAAADGGAEA